jgi:UTP--glucose-1-phosphate uridylyltransferase
MNKRISTVIFPVAGLGTRFLPATKVLAKELLPIVDKPLIQFATDEAVEAGADTLVFVTNRNKHALEDHFDAAFELEHRLEAAGKTQLLNAARFTLAPNVSRVSVTQPEARGLGHAVLCGAPALRGDAFGVILPDDLITHFGLGVLAQMGEIYARTGHSVIAVEEVPPDQTDRYGIVEIDADNRILSIVEKPKPAVAPSNLAVVGRYILSSRIMDLLAHTRPGAGGEIQLTDAIAELLKFETVLAYRFKGKRYDCGSKTGFVEATIDFALTHPETRDATRRYLSQLKL